MSGIFNFKQFSIDQSNCAMKVNTDGVLLAALCESKSPSKILDIGTGTGLIALMLAQRFADARIDAVEIDQAAAATAAKNFKNSTFSSRLNLISSSIADYFRNSGSTYDLIVSNPPFFINDLRSENPKKELARHTDITFFETILNKSESALSMEGSLYLILPVDTGLLIKSMVSNMKNLKLQEELFIRSFSDSIAHRSIMKFGFGASEPGLHDFVIYEDRGVYSEGYRELLKDFLTIF